MKIEFAQLEIPAKVVKKIDELLEILSDYRR
jgi:hypothetical protein